MKHVLLKIAGSLASLLGVMSVIAGSRVMIGSFDPGYITFPLLISYNIIMGIVSIPVGLLIWRNHKYAIGFSIFITLSHLGVLVSLLTVFNSIISVQSIHAMIFRSTTWVLLLLLLTWIRSDKKF